jgi:hypothetical protein
MPSSRRPEPAASELPAELEARLYELRTAQAEWEREQAAIGLERAAIDDERATWMHERARLEEELRRALRWSPRHWLGVAVHRSAAFRRLRSGRGRKN